MKKLFQTVKAWLRSRVTAMSTLRVYENENVDENLLKVKGDGVKVKDTRSVYVNDNDDDNLVKVERRCKHRSSHSTGSEVGVFPPWGDKRGAANQAKRSLTLPEVQEVLCSKYELRYNLLSEQSEYRERDTGGDFLPITKRVYMT